MLRCFSSSSSSSGGDDDDDDERGTNAPAAKNDLAVTLGAAGLDWNDRVGIQRGFTLEEKGWSVDVEWRSSKHGGTGVFARQSIASGTILRRGVLGVNLKEFRSVRDIEDFCRDGSGVDDDGDDYESRLEYVKDYLWGFHKDADERGYAISSGDDDDDEDDRFFGMWVPGNGLNHDASPNTVYRWNASSNDGIDLVALGDVSEGDELFDDYRRHGRSPPWLREFAAERGVTLNFADCNDFV